MLSLDEKIDAINEILGLKSEITDSNISRFHEDEKEAWFKGCVISLFAKTIMHDRAKEQIESLNLSIEPKRQEAFIDKVCSDSLLHYEDKIWDKALNSIIKNIAKNEWARMEAGPERKISSPQQFKAYYNVKGDYKWLSWNQEGENKMDFDYIREITPKSVKYSFTGKDNAERTFKLDFPFTTDEYDDFMVKVRLEWKKYGA